MAGVINKKLQDLIFIEATGFSMWPFLKAEEKLIIKKVSMQDLEVGDIILYRANNQIACHRLIKKIRHKEGQLLYARGDNSVFSPELVTEEMFLGKAIGIIKNGKITSFNEMKWQIIKRLICKIAPLVSWFARMIKPGYNKFIRLRGQGKANEK